jgi:hypothetical protein
MGRSMTKVRGRGSGSFIQGCTLLELALALMALAMLVAEPVAGSTPPRAAGSSHLFPSGYRLVGGDGGIFAFGAPFEGSAAGIPTACPPNTSDRSMPSGSCWSMATTPSDMGYWILNAYTGAVAAYGDAASYGDRTASNTGGADFWPTSTAMTPTADGKGYWILNQSLNGYGTVQAFGDANFYGDESTVAPHVVPNGVPMGMVGTVNGRGYWIVDSDGGVFAFGDATFCGSTGAAALNASVVGIARMPGGGGYLLAAADGGVFTFGDAVFGGSMGGTDLNAPVVGIAITPNGQGYWLVGADGGVFAFGGAPFLGSMGGQVLRQPIFGISAQPGGIV